MGRPKGSKNRYKARRRRDAYRTALLKIFDKEIVAEIEQLSADTGISVHTVAQHMAKEGTSCLRNDGYKSTIAFVKRIGKVVHERDLERISESGEGAAPEESQDSIGTEAQSLDRIPESAGKLTPRSNDVSLERGFGTEDNEDHGTPGLPPGIVAQELVKQIVAPLEFVEPTAPGELPITDLPI